MRSCNGTHEHDTMDQSYDSTDFEPYMCVLECGPMIHIFKPISSASGVFTLATCKNKHARQTNTISSVLTGRS